MWLRERRHHTHPCYFQASHGWPASALTTLMEARFAATPALLTALEELDRESWNGEETQAHYRRALYYVLGMVKDPAAIPWLLSRTTGTGRAEVYDTWLPTWHRGVRGPEFAERAWLENELAWGGVFRALATNADTPERRLVALEVLQQWFHDAATVSFFEAARSDIGATAEQRLTIESFFERNGLPVDDARVQVVVDELGVTEAGRRRLWRHSRRMRHEAFVPWLMSLLETERFEEFHPWFALEDITLQTELSSAREWRAWWARCGERGPDGWVAAFFARLAVAYDRDPWNARYLLGRAAYKSWGNPRIADHLDEIARLPELQDMLPSLVRCAYRPHLREQLGRALTDLANDDGATPQARAAARETLADYGYVHVELDWMSTLPYARGP